MSWFRRRQFDSPPSTTRQLDNTVDDGQSERNDVFSEQFAAEWDALTEADKDDIVEATAEQHQVMEEYGITSFHACSRGGWNEPPTLIRVAAMIRAETEMLREVMDNRNAIGVPDVESSNRDLWPRRKPERRRWWWGD